MRILVLGGGGREAALYQALKQSKLAEHVYISQENGGIPKSDLAPINDPSKFEHIADFVKENVIQLIIVGSEVPLAKGIKNYFLHFLPQVMLFGPNLSSSRLEASKSFAVEYMIRNNIPTAKTHICDNLKDAMEKIRDHTLPLVIKADGLASGKGVSIHYNQKSASQELSKIFNQKIYGTAGDKVLLQEFLRGREASLFALCNGKEAIYLPTAQDYKPAFDGNQGPNTGGMGSYCPASVLNEGHVGFIHQNIMKKILKDFQYTGILYIGLMIHSEKAEDVSVVEFNVRFGDPETQSVLPMLKEDILPYLLWSCGREEFVPKIQKNGFQYMPQKTGACVNVVIASKGYPGRHEKNIFFVLPEKIPKNIHIIHAGDKAKKNGYESKGGRILSIVGRGMNLNSAKKNVYDFIQSMKEKNRQTFAKFHFRIDIGAEFNTKEDN